MSPRLEVICLTNGMFAENCYILADRDESEAVLVDPGEETGLFLSRLRHEGLDLKAIWLTHAHLDHIQGVKEVKEATGVEIFLHPDDRPLYDNVVDQAKWLGLSTDQPPPPERELVPGEKVFVGGLEFDVRHVPGHSPGGVAFVGYGVTVSGDALFAGSIGRTDLPGGDHSTLIASIQRELLTLPEETVVYPGHGPETTVGREGRSNPFLTGAVPFGI